LDWWRLYYYYEHDYNILPRAKDGGLNYGLIMSMRAIDQYHREAEENRRTMNREQESSDNMPTEEELF